MIKKRPAFTLIELLVVIAIIGLLATLSILALNQSRARARDAKRVSDIRQIQTALEMYYHAAGHYPPVSQVKAGASIEFDGYVYLANVPAPPMPYDGSECSRLYTAWADADAYGSYAYRSFDSTHWGFDDHSYLLQYCLGGDIADIEKNTNVIATPYASGMSKMQAVSMNPSINSFLFH